MLVIIVLLNFFHLLQLVYHLYSLGLTLLDDSYLKMFTSLVNRNVPEGRFLPVVSLTNVVDRFLFDDFLKALQGLLDVLFDLFGSNLFGILSLLTIVLLSFFVVDRFVSDEFGGRVYICVFNSDAITCVLNRIGVFQLDV